MPGGFDIKTVITDDGSDWAIENGDLAFDSTPASLALITAFTDARADDPDEPLPDPRSNDRRGYWADTPGDRWGSLLWLLEAATLVPVDIARAKIYLQDAFGRWIETRMIESLTVVTEKVGDGSASWMDARVTLNRGSAAAWPELWEDLRGSLFELPQPGLRLRLLVS